MITDELQQLVSALAGLEQVECVMLAGSMAAGRADAASDYDVYVYTSSPLPLAARQRVLAPLCRQMEWQNQFWETEDDGVLNSGREIELIYRDLGFLPGILASVVEGHQAWVGYTSCFWANLLDSQILFDRHGWGEALKRRFSVPYPQALKENIIRKNFPLLRRAMPAYYHQIAKALKRDDPVSVNHRTAALLASYFDILFAANELPHPGEKRLLARLAELPSQPINAEAQVRALLLKSTGRDASLLMEIDALERELADWLREAGLGHCLA